MFNDRRYENGESLRQALMVARENGGQILDGGGKRYARFVLNGELPKAKDHERELKSGLVVGSVVINKIVPRILASDEETKKLIEPFFDKDALNYIKEYITIHGTKKQDNPISRTDMLLTNEGLRVIEINPDAPEGYGLTHAADEIQNVSEHKQRNSMWKYFHYAQLKFLGEMRRRSRDVRAVIPFWSKGNLSPIDALYMQNDLQEKGINAVALPVEQLRSGNPNDFNCILRTISTGTETWKAHKHLPLYADKTYLQLPQFPAPWTDIAGLKHFISLAYKISRNPFLQKKYGVNIFEAWAMSKVLLETHSPTSTSIRGMISKFNRDKEGWVAKEIHSSHGDGFRDGHSVISALKSGKFILQRKADCKLTGRITYLDVNGEIRHGNKWLVDMDPMGVIGGRVYLCLRACPSHPMNVAGQNGGGLYNP